MGDMGDTYDMWSGFGAVGASARQTEDEIGLYDEERDRGRDEGDHGRGAPAGPARQLVDGDRTDADGEGAVIRAHEL